MLRSDELDYILQATRSSVKRYGGDQPSLSHLAQVLSDKWSSAFDEIFGDDGAQDVEALLRKNGYIGDESEVRDLLKSADSRKAILVTLRERLQPAITEAGSPSLIDPQREPPDQGEVAKDQEGIIPSPSQASDAVSSWPSRTERYVHAVDPRDDLLERDEPIDLILSTLSQSRRRVPVVIGSPGIGRTSLMGGLATRLNSVGQKRLWRIDPSRLGPEPEGALDRIVRDCRPEDVLVIDDIDSVVSVGSAYPNGMALRVLTSAVMRTELNLVLVCDARRFQQLVLIAENLVSQLVQVRLPQLSDGAVRQIVERFLPEVEERYGVTISSELHAEVCLPPRSIDNSVHPGLAADRLDAAASRARILGVDVARVSHLASIRSASKTPHCVESLKERLSACVQGQEIAVDTVASRLALTLASLDLRPERPDGVFLFVGPTGVGKTKLARALSLTLFGSEENLIRLDMSEYVHQWAVSRLVGPMPGYVGSTEPENWLTTKVSQMPECVVLLDEIEKAHPVVWNMFLQVFDAGRLTDSRGRTADFANAVIVMTSNLGAAAASGPGLGFESSSASVERGRQKIMSAVKEAMAPELINRIDEFVVFDPLSAQAIEQIAGTELAAVKERLSANGWNVTYGSDVVHHIASTSFDPAFGARHLQRNIERGFLSVIATAMDREAHVVVSDGELVLKKTD